MTVATTICLPDDLAADLQHRYFWWEHVGTEPRSDLRILAQAMTFASFAEVRRLETTLGVSMLADALQASQPGWFDSRSWEFWRGRLAHATGRALPDHPPQRSLGVRVM